MNKGVKSGWESQMLWKVSVYTTGIAYLGLETHYEISLGWREHPFPSPL